MLSIITKLLYSTWRVEIVCRDAPQHIRSFHVLQRTLVLKIRDVKLFEFCSFLRQEFIWGFFQILPVLGYRTPVLKANNGIISPKYGIATRTLSSNIVQSGVRLLYGHYRPNTNDFEWEIVNISNNLVILGRLIDFNRPLYYIQ